MGKNNDSRKIFTSGDDFLKIFLPIIDDEEQRRLEELEKEEVDWDFLRNMAPDEDSEIEPQRFV